MRPTFPQKNFEAVKEIAFNWLAGLRAEPEWLSQSALRYKIYEDDPDNCQRVYWLGRADQFRNLSREDAADFYRRNYTPENTAIAVTGNIDPQRLLSVLEARFGSWKSETSAVSAETDKKTLSAEPLAELGAPEEKRPEAVPELKDKAEEKEGQTIYVVDRPGAPQSAIKAGCIGFARTDPGYFSLDVMNAVLGGSVMSRINQNLRERNKYSYGAYSVFYFEAEPGPFLVSSLVQTDKTVPAVKEILKEIRSMADPVPADELQRAKNYLCYQFPAEFSNGSKVCRYVRDMAFYNLPADYYSAYIDNVMKIDNDSMKVYRDFFGSRPMKIVVVGDAKAIAEQLKDSSDFKIELLPADEFLGPEVKTKP